MKLMMMMVMSN